MREFGTNQLMFFRVQALMRDALFITAGARHCAFRSTNVCGFDKHRKTSLKERKAIKDLQCTGTVVILF